MSSLKCTIIWGLLLIASCQKVATQQPATYRPRSGDVNPTPVGYLRNDRENFLKGKDYRIWFPQSFAPATVETYVVRVTDESSGGKTIFITLVDGTPLTSSTQFLICLADNQGSGNSIFSKSDGAAQELASFSRSDDGESFRCANSRYNADDPNHTGGTLYYLDASLSGSGDSPDAFYFFASAPTIIGGRSNESLATECSDTGALGLPENLECKAMFVSELGGCFDGPDGWLTRQGWQDYAYGIPVKSPDGHTFADDLAKLALTDGELQLGAPLMDAGTGDYAQGSINLATGTGNQGCSVHIYGADGQSCVTLSELNAGVPAANGFTYLDGTLRSEPLFAFSCVSPQHRLACLCK